MKRLARLALGAALTAPLLAAPAALAAPAGEETSHVVGSGETLNGIANRAGVPASAIAEANHLTAPYVVKLGQTLTIPRPAAPSSRAASAPSGPAATATRYTVTSGETLGGIANRTGVSAQTIARANNLAAPYVVRVGQTLAIPRDEAPVRSAARTIETAAPSRSPTPSAPPANTADSYTVKPGETLGGIANRTGVSASLLAETNGIQPPFVVKVGQTLRIPRKREYTVGARDDGFSVALQAGVPWDQIALANGLSPQATLRPGQKLVIPTLIDPAKGAAAPDRMASATATPAAPAPTASRFAWPVNGPIDRAFATGTNYHDGIDIKAAKGTVVKAAAAGTVRFAGMEKEQFGNLVVVDNGDGWFTAYAFLSRINVKKGDRVTLGQRVGLVGSTGLAKGNELHFEIRKDGKPVNPVDELPKAP
ncbi:LysM peptidoglycan-binding domain-containing protein [Novosphingobium sp. 1949]|uniref:LysM peptidoglycan-binding domain-containing protein n=1 Tax=Novosphingobium organovorum TaxID=2930092 RepID=A0ABT0BEJ4_9SPHN|nr:LysM peptidoglycan-binding domain-containing protein [Novosphingobium organovorum]MCJ2183211.1 LysM peptidoglycan-binding domain-containing protein [Novosphingobium organovorum]